MEFEQLANASNNKSCFIKSLTKITILLLNTIVTTVDKIK